MAEFDQLEEIDLNEFGDPSADIVPGTRPMGRFRPRVFKPAKMDQDEEQFFNDLKLKYQEKVPTVADRIIAQRTPEIVKGSREKIKRAETIAATLDISFAEAYDGEEYYSKEMQKRAPDLFKVAGSSVMRGWGQAYQQWGAAWGYFGANNIESVLTDYGKAISSGYMPTLKPPEVSVENFSNLEWYATTVAENLPLGLSLVPASIWAAYAAVGSAGLLVPSLGVFGKAVIGGLGATAASRPVESAMEARQAGQEASIMGMSAARIKEIENQVFIDNMKLGGMDVAQIAAAFTPLRALGRAAPKALATRILASTGKFTAGVLSEGLEESIQSAISQSAVEGVGFFEALKRFNPEMQEGTMIGLVFGGGIPVAGSVFNALTDRVTQSMKPRLQEVYQVAEQAALQQGLEPQAAALQALDAVAETPEGKAHIEKVMGDLKDIVEGKDFEPVTTEQMEADIEKFGGDQQFVMGQIEEGIDIASDESLDEIIKSDATIEQMLGVEPDIAMVKEAAPPPAPGFTRYYRADVEGATEPGGVNWATDQAYVERKYGGADSQTLYLDVPDAVADPNSYGVKQSIIQLPRESVVGAKPIQSLAIPNDSLAKRKIPLPENFLVSEETYQEALKSLKAKSSGLHANLDPFVLGDLVKIGAYHLERGVRTFAQWSKLMVERFGETIKPHLQEVWEQSNSLIKRKIPSNIDLGEEELAATKELEAKPDMPAKDVKGQVRRITGQNNLVRLIREDVALRAAMQKAEQNAKIAYREGTKDAQVKAKAELREVLITAKVAAEAFGFKQGFKVAEKITRKELVQAHKDQIKEGDDTRKVIAKLLQENLPPELRGQFIPGITSSRLTKKHVDSVLDRIAKTKDNLTREDLTGELAKLQKNMSGIHVDYQKRITELIGDINTKNITGKTRENAEALMKYADENVMPSGVNSKTLATIKRLEGKQAADMSIEDLQELVELGKHLAQMGRLKTRLLKYKSDREQKIALDKLLATTNSLDPKSLGTKEQTSGQKQRLGAFALYIDGLNAIRVAEMIDGYKGGQNGKLARDLFHHELAARWDIRTTIEAAINEAIEAGITDMTPEMEGRLMVNIVNREGAETPTLRLMEKYGYQEIPELTQAEEKFIAILKKYSSDMFVDQIAAVFEETTHSPFPKDPLRILPRKYEGDHTKRAPEEVLLDTKYQVSSANDRFTIERLPDVDKTPRTDIWKIFEEGINEQLWYLHMQPALDNVRTLVKSTQYKKRAGKLATNWWADHLDIIGRRGWSSTATHGEWSQSLKIWRGNLSKGILGWRLSTMFIQPFAVFEASAFALAKHGPVAAARTFREFTKSWVVPGYAKAYMDNDPTHALAIREAGEVAIEEAMQEVRGGKGLSKGKDGAVAWFMRNGLKGLQKTDLRTAVGVQIAAEQNLIASGVDPAEAKRDAAVMMDMSQSSSDVSMRPHVLASGEAARTILTFQTFQLNMAGMIAHDMIVKGIVKSGWKARLSAIAAIMLWEMGQIAGDESRKYLWEVIHRRKLPDESLLQQVLLAVPSAIPVFGSAFSMTRSRHGADIPFTKTVGNALNLPAQIAIYAAQDADKKNAGPVIRAAIKASEAAITLGYGFPGTSQGFDFLDGMLFPEKEKSSNMFKARRMKVTQ